MPRKWVSWIFMYCCQLLKFWSWTLEHCSSSRRTGNPGLVRWMSRGFLLCLWTHQLCTGLFSSAIYWKFPFGWQIQFKLGTIINIIPAYIRFTDAAEACCTLILGIWNTYHLIGWNKRNYCLNQWTKIGYLTFYNKDTISFTEP